MLIDNPYLTFGQMGVQPSTSNPIAGNRPHPDTQPIGQFWYATDGLYGYVCGPHPKIPGRKMWYPSGFQSSRSILAINAGPVTSTAQRFAQYDIRNNTYLQATVAGQPCNAVVSGAAAPGAQAIVVLLPRTAVTLDAIPNAGEFMSSNDGRAIFYRPGVNSTGPNISLGIVAQATAAGQSISALWFDTNYET